MRVELSKAVVDSASCSSDVIKLHKLLIFACEGRHVILFDSPDSLQACLGTIGEAARPHYADALMEMGRVAAHLSADVATIRVDNNAPESWGDPLSVLSLEKALATLAEPLGILVENAENDVSFLYGIMRPSERRRLVHAVSKGWAVPLHGGGSNLATELPRRLAIPEQCLRTFVMFDSDRRHPDELEPNWVPTPPEACQGFNVQRILPTQLRRRHWMLRRRFIESYMPEPEINEGISAHVHPDAVNAYFRMGQHARWYFNMKNGFKGDAPAENRHRCRELYDAVAPADRAALETGFGRTLADHFGKAVNKEFAWDGEARQEAAEAIPNLMRLL